MDYIISLDKKIFHLLNSNFTFTILDFVFPIITSWYTCALLVLSCVISLTLYNNGKYRYLSICIIISIIFSDIISSHLIKKSVKRLRPCNAEENVRLLVNKSKGYSFTSSHGANGGSIVGVIVSELPKMTSFIIVLVVCAIAYSRIYVGVHYPLDVLCGFILGFFIGKLVLISYKIFYSQRLISNSSNSE